MEKFRSNDVDSSNQKNTNLKTDSREGKQSPSCYEKPRQSPLVYGANLYNSSGLYQQDYLISIVLPNKQTLKPAYHQCSHNVQKSK